MRNERGAGGVILLECPQPARLFCARPSKRCEAHGTGRRWRPTQGEEPHASARPPAAGEQARPASCPVRFPPAGRRQTWLPLAPLTYHDGASDCFHKWAVLLVQGAYLLQRPDALPRADLLQDMDG